ncbi:hypothetical protein [Cypionkella sp. TWP1-2-1b2]|uniref:hypothetical protein n=1 Tax=Cypionkella sp. TWP1-2-1b2 TaxID=2804675 RepID=UPI003CF250C5
MTEGRRVFVLWGCVGSAMGVGGTFAELISGRMDLVSMSHWFGLTGVASFVAAICVLVPAWFLMGGIGGVTARLGFSNVFRRLAREEPMHFGAAPEWMRVFFGIDQDGSMLR